MNERKEGVLHIIFIFIGLALICLGTFYYFTDDKIDLDKSDNKEQEKPKEEKDIIKQINLMNNVETSITLKNKNEIKIKYNVDDETHIGTFYINNNLMFETTSELELCDQYYLYNNSIIIYCVYGSATSGHLYVMSSSKTNKIDKFYDKEYTMIPESIQFKDNKLVVNGIRVFEGGIIKQDDKEINICNVDERTENNISLDSIASADYELKIIDDKTTFNFIKNSKTIEQFINENCKIVE